MVSKNYNEQLSQKLILKLKALQKDLPAFTEAFFRGIADSMQIKTRIAYAYDLKIFFYYLYTQNDKFASRSSSTDFYLEDLDILKAGDLDKYSEFLNFYTVPDKKDPSKSRTYTNSEKGKMRKLSSVRSFYKFYYKKELISANPTLLIDMPKLHDKSIIRLEVNEVANLLDAIENGTELTSKQKAYYEKTRLRDLAMISLFLGTGIRISECVGLNISDFNFKENSFLVTRKGGNQAILYYPEEVKKSLVDYLEKDRLKITAASEADADAMFLSLQKKRITARAVENLLKKYIDISVPLKHITPHKLRSTYGTNLYRETNDIYLVADVLGHKDVNTTKKHYAAIEEDRRRYAAKMTKLRED